MRTLCGTLLLLAATAGWLFVDLDFVQAFWLCLIGAIGAATVMTTWA